jgi:phage N-6-adenine-methyltransferase
MGVVASFAGKFESTRQDWTTPDDVFFPIEEEFHFTLDAAASSENKRAASFLCEADDSMVCSWGTHTVWLNPPYGDKGRSLSGWVKKAHRASVMGATVVMLIPARTNTVWFHDYCLKLGEVRFLKGRPKFGGGLTTGYHSHYAS